MTAGDVFPSAVTFRLCIRHVLS